ncbi:hypothetical protein F383_20064 [Gossypium arboreum]|uniref:Uncharacterized protein n=1 Tax=Gossypium arboreum TaxID=29729 RepID=A0A0B0NKA4_GOSAR|nr:hypothetical protein F383_20064 [Gossypium arboreum]
MWYYSYTYIGITYR